MLYCSLGFLTNLTLGMLLRSQPVAVLPTSGLGREGRWGPVAYEMLEAAVSKLFPIDQGMRARKGPA